MDTLTFDCSHKLPNISFASIEAHAWACGIAVVSQRMDPKSYSRWICTYDSYLGHLYVVVNNLWRKLRKGKLDAFLVEPGARTFIPRDVFAYRFSKWTRPGPSDRITKDQLSRIHVLAERAMGGFITEAAKRDPRGHLTSEGLDQVRRLDLSLEEHLERCPAYIDTSRPDEVDYLMEGDQIKILFRGEVCATFRANAKEVETALAAYLVVDEVYGVAQESLEVFWSSDFQGFKVEGLEVRVTEDRVTWVLSQGRVVVCPDGSEEVLKTITPNNENFKYFLALRH